MELHKKSKKKIFVGLSGGVDSSVSAFLLKKEGYDVTGVFIKVWQPDFLPCTWKEDRRDAMRVCAHLEIPFQTLDLSDVYKKNVVDYMLDEYRAGRTPNPDVMCNRSVKFGAFLRFAKEAGADGIATGHYAQIHRTKDGQNGQMQALFTSKDEDKDQTYFLWQIAKSDLHSLLFPVGHLEKEETRKIADRAGLLTARKRDSQGLCFIGKLNMKDFLGHFIPEKSGDIVLKTGEKVGEHRGALFYTLGERHGFDITKRGLKGPLYVVEKDMKNNRLVVGTVLRAPETQAYIELKDVNWIGEEPQPDCVYVARIRHRGEFLPVRVEIFNTRRARLTFQRETPLVASGQSVVLYERSGQEKGELRCLGGGIAI